MTRGVQGSEFLKLSRSHIRIINPARFNSNSMEFKKDPFSHISIGYTFKIHTKTLNNILKL